MLLSVKGMGQYNFSLAIGSNTKPLYNCNDVTFDYSNSSGQSVRLYIYYKLNLTDSYTQIPGYTTVGNGTSSNYGNSTSGFYKAEFKNSTGTSTLYASSEYEVEIRPTPSSPVITSNTPICEGATLTFNTSAVSGGTFSWTGVNGFLGTGIAPSITNATAASTGNYSATVTVDGCTSVPSNTLSTTVNTRPTVNITSPSTTICDGSNLLVHMDVTAIGNWTITVNDGVVNGSGSGDRTFFRSPSTTTQYSIVNAVDANCSSVSSDLTGSVIVTVNPTPTVAAITPQIRCNTIASDIINFSGTVTGTTYAWTNSQSTIGIAGSGSGTITSTTLTNSTNSPVISTFTVTPTANSCSGPSGTFTITVNPTPTVAAITPQIRCNTIASDIINFSGTVTGTTYAWTNSQTSIGIAASGSGTITSTTLTNSTNSPVISTFTVTPTANSCAGPTGTFSITVNPTPTVAAITSQIRCNTIASDIINFSGTVTGTTYAWTNSQTSIGIAASGSGTITSTTLTNSTNSPVISTFTVTPTANSCAGPTGTFSITVNPTPTVAAITSQIRCNTIASDIINFSGTVTGTTYAWTNTQSSIGIAASGSGTITSTTLTNSTNSPVISTFTVTPTANSCPGPAGTFSITVNPLPTKPTLTSSIICEGQTTTVSMLTPTGTNTYTYTWTVPTGVASSTTKTISTTKAGNYSLTITDVNSCTSEAGTGIVTVNPLPTKPTLTSSTICEGETASILMLTPTGTNTYTYNWTVPTGVATSTIKTVSTSKAGTYSLTITDANSCTSEVGTATVTVNPLPTKPTLTSATICEGQTTNVSMSLPAGTYTYTWIVPTGVVTSTTNTVSTSKAGTYSLTITDANSCTSEFGTATVTVNPLPTKPTLTSATICDGETATVTMLTPTGTNTYTYTWTVPTGVATSTTKTVSTNKAGTYSLIITDVNSCTSEVGTGTVTVNPLPTLTITNPAAVCAPGTIDLTATTITAGSTASLTYTYYTNATATNTLTNTSLIGASGTYYIKGTSTLNCSAIQPVNTIINPIPSFNLLSPSVCAGSVFTINANPLSGTSSDYNYTWVVPSGVANPGNVSNFTTTIPGVYTATIKNKSTNCESAALNNTATFYPLPTAAAIVASDNKVMEGATLNLTAAASGGTGAYLYTWVPNSTTNYTISGGSNALFNALREGTVNIKYQVKDANNCSTQSANFVITIAPATIIFEIPNAFTPNGDSMNDELKIISNVGVRSLTSFKIFSRSGNLVFESRDLSRGWDGRYNGNLLPADIYYWTAVYVDRNNVTNPKNGTVLLLK
jgi:gliding motility-associated-like protein